MKNQLDSKDKKILTILQANSALSVKDIGEQVGLSFTPTYERIKNMERSGVIKKYVAIVDRAKIGIDILVYCNVTLRDQSKETSLAFEKAVYNIPEIQEVVSLSGTYDYMLKITAKDIVSYNEFVTSIIADTKVIIQYHSSIVLNEIKNDTAFVLKDS